MGSLFSRPAQSMYIPPPPAPPPPAPTLADAKRDSGVTSGIAAPAGGTDITRGNLGSDAQTNRKTLLGQ